MNKFYFLTLSLIGLLNSFAMAGSTAEIQACTSLAWTKCELLPIKVGFTGPFGTRIPFIQKIRAGYIKENSDVKFQGNILYYEGLGDSMQNHLPLFNLLSTSGFRIIAFDYMGQGGSHGFMNETRIKEIHRMGEQVWNFYARDLENHPKKTIIGWSTGGLAAYIQATGKDLLPGIKPPDRVILIAPGIVPKLIVGKGLLNWPPLEISMDTLTTANYNSETDPHIDPIRPTSPVEVTDFAQDLLCTARKYRRANMIVPSPVEGMVLLSGPKDTYVDALKTLKIVNKNAKSFLVKIYESALHEIDNETSLGELQPGTVAREDILNFLLGNKEKIQNLSVPEIQTKNIQEDLSDLALKSLCNWPLY